MCSKSTLDAIKDSTGHLRAAIMAVTEPARQQVLHHQGQAAPREDADGRKKTGPEGPVCMQCRDRSAHDALAITALGRVRLGSALAEGDRKSTRLNSSHSQISYAVFCLKKKKQEKRQSC